MHKYLIPILIVFTSCGNRQENTRYTQAQIESLKLNNTKVLKANTDSLITIDLNPFLKQQHFDFGALVKEVKLIPLETTDESLLDDFRKVVITPSHIYIHDDFKGGGIVIFDKEGNFIKRISNGRGPGELIRLYDIDFEEKNNELVAYQHSFLLFFTPSGEFIRQQRLPIGFYNFVTIPEGYVFKTIRGKINGHLEDLSDNTLLITDKKFKIKSAGIPKPHNQVAYTWRNYLCKNEELYISHRFTDTIYQYTSLDNQLKARYFLDYSSKKLPERHTINSFNGFDNIVRKKDYFFHLGKYLDTGLHHVIFLNNYYWQGGLQVVIYRDKHSGKLIGGTNADFNPTEMPRMAFPNWVSGEYFISTYLPTSDENDLFTSNSTIISAEDKAKAKGLDENSNPVLVLFKLKHF